MTSSLLLRRAHEWGADHFRFIQYPRMPRRVYGASSPSWLDVALKWMLFSWLMFLIWGGVAFWACVALLLLLT
jgi:hypothetical protein